MSRGLKEVEAQNASDDTVGQAKMNVNATKKHHPRQPLSAFSKTSIAVLLVLTLFWVGLAVFIRQPSLLTTSVINLLIIALIALGIRWAPVLASILGGLVLYVFTAVSEYPLAHLSHPKDVYGSGVLPWLAFLLFFVILLVFWSAAMLVVTGLAAVVHNYAQRERRTPRWFSAALSVAIGIFLGALILGVISQPAPAATTSSTGSNATPIVHLYVGSFGQSSITISKGSQLTLIDDGAYHHNISDGTWVNGQPAPKQQAGEPVVKNHDIKTSGASFVIGPFSTAGTYHIFCSLHEGMTLTIIVQ